MLDARQENAMTLATALGIPEDAAGELLKCRVVVSHDERCRFATLFATTAAMLLGRMMNGFVDSNGETVELIIGNVLPRSNTEKRVYAQILADSIVITPARPGPSATNPDIHLVFAVLSAVHGAAAVSRRVAFVDTAYPPSPIVIRPRELLGDDIDLLSRAVHLGTAVLAGGGAVANGLLTALHMFDVVGTLHIADPKRVVAGNLNRCLWFELEDLGHPKAHQLCLRAQPSFNHLRLIPHEMTVGQFVSEKLASRRIDRLIVSVDSRRARRSLQTEFPREVYDASTTGIEEVVLHFNRRPNDLACLSCVYKESAAEITHEAHVAELLGVTIEEVRCEFISAAVAMKISRKYSHVPISEIEGRAFDSLFKQLCGMGALKAAGDRHVLAPFSFVPVLAGTYLAIELVRRVALGIAELPFNYWRVSPWVSPNVELRQLRRALGNCEFCSSPLFRGVEKKIWCNP